MKTDESHQRHWPPVSAAHPSWAGNAERALSGGCLALGPDPFCLKVGYKCVRISIKTGTGWERAWGSGRVFSYEESRV
jgi:hypothetical protein